MNFRKWEVLLCNLCGSTGCHVRCGHMPETVTEWHCADCLNMLQDSAKRQKEELRQRRIENRSVLSDKIYELAKSTLNQNSVNLEPNDNMGESHSKEINEEQKLQADCTNITAISKTLKKRGRPKKRMRGDRKSLDSLNTSNSENSPNFKRRRLTLANDDSLSENIHASKILKNSNTIENSILSNSNKDNTSYVSA